VAFLGKAAYAGLSGQRELNWGRQAMGFEGAIVWILPNPSGRNRAFTLDGLVAAYRELYLEMMAPAAHNVRTEN
jgi:TDG/mug DNA glycosylase family protein